MRYRTGLIRAGIVFLWMTGCWDEGYTDDRQAREPDAAASDSIEATAYPGTDTLSREDLEQGRLDDAWRRFAEQDSTRYRTDSRAPDRTVAVRIEIDTTATAEDWEDVTAETVNQGAMLLPLSGDVSGPSVLRVQILLDRIRFSPGIIDGHWGKNTEKAVYWLQRREGLEATGEVDSTTFRHLVALAGEPDPWIEPYVLTEQDVAGPFVEIPEDIYEQAEMDRLGYESLAEKLSEQFHIAPEVLQKLNPDAPIDSLRAGDTIQVPNLQASDPAAGAKVAQLIVSDRGHYVHAIDSTGLLLYHFPSTLGSAYDPSPRGAYEVTSVTEDPWWHYQPDILAHVDDSEPDARIPPGPNNAVGVVWIDLSEPHYGIHGTSAPETIGYATSAGCVRLTNWDALFLGRRLAEGTPVEFRDTDGDGFSS